MASLDFTRRGARVDELLDALEALWTTDPAHYEGAQLSVPPHHSPLKPARRPRPPFYLAGCRCASSGSGDVDGLRAQRSLPDRLAAEAGRGPKAIGTVLRVSVDAEHPHGTGRRHDRTGP
ncbi:hypothetical protein ACQ4WX_47625 [Streptomyces lasalocidi]